MIPKPVNFDFLIQEIYDVANFNRKPILNINDIKMVFSKLHLNHFSKGGLYLLDAIALCYDNENLLDNFKCICLILSHKYNVSEKNIQWSIESSLKTMSKYVKKEHLSSILIILFCFNPSSIDTDIFSLSILCFLILSSI